MTDAHYEFLPWTRKGLAAQPELLSAGADGRLTVDVALNLEATAKGGGSKDTPPTAPQRNITLQGPGDVIGMDTGEILRTIPSDGDTEFTVNYFPAVEFDDPDFLWRFSAESHDSESSAPTTGPKPWLTLLVLANGNAQAAPGDTTLQQPEWTAGPASSTSRPLDSIDVLKPVGYSELPLPRLEKAYRTAHVQLTTSPGDPEPVTDVKGDAAAVGSVVTALEQDAPDMTMCRLLCLRKLRPYTSYTGFLVPTFAAGVAAGLGDPLDGVSHTDLAWTAADLSSKSTLRLPYMYKWSFSTGSSGDFESLLMALQPRTSAQLQASGVGTLSISTAGTHSHIALPDGTPMPPIKSDGGATMTVETALRNLGPETPTEQSSSYTSALGTVLDQTFTYSTDSVVPPVYGRWHARIKQMPSSKLWVNLANTQLRWRFAAGLGVETVRRNQETYMKSAWEQLGSLPQANRVVAQGQLAGPVRVAQIDKWLSPMTNVELSVSGMLQGATRVADGTYTKTFAANTHLNHVVGAPRAIVPTAKRTGASGKTLWRGLDLRPATQANELPAKTKRTRPVGEGDDVGRHDFVGSIVGRMTEDDLAVLSTAVSSTDFNGQTLTVRRTVGGRLQGALVWEMGRAPSPADLERYAPHLIKGPGSSKVVSEPETATGSSSTVTPNKNLGAGFLNNDPRNPLLLDSVPSGLGDVSPAVGGQKLSGANVPGVAGAGSGGGGGISMRSNVSAVGSSGGGVSGSSGAVARSGTRSAAPIATDQAKISASYTQGNDVHFAPGQLSRAYTTDTGSKVGGIVAGSRAPAVPSAPSGSKGITPSTELNPRVPGGVGGMFGTAFVAPTLKDYVTLSRDELSELLAGIEYTLDNHAGGLVKSASTDATLALNSTTKAALEAARDALQGAGITSNLSSGSGLQSSKGLSESKLPGAGSVGLLSESLVSKSSQFSGMERDVVPVASKMEQGFAGADFSSVNIHMSSSGSTTPAAPAPPTTRTRSARGGRSAKKRTAGGAGAMLSGVAASSGSASPSSPASSYAGYTGLNSKDFSTKAVVPLSANVALASVTAIPVMPSSGCFTSTATVVPQYLATAAAGMRVLDGVDTAIPEESEDSDAKIMADGIKSSMAPVQSLLPKVSQRTGLPAVGRGVDLSHGLAVTVKQALYEPRLDVPLWEPLYAQSENFILGGIGNVPNNTLALLDVNNAFLEAYLLGANHELGREFLWREYPAVLWGTFFRQFWDYTAMDVAEGNTEPTVDIDAITSWASALGHNPAAGGAAAGVVLLVKGDLLQRYPDTHVYAMSATYDAGATNDEIGEDGSPELPWDSAPYPVRGTEESPVFRITLNPQVTLIGFSMTPEQAVGNGESDPGYFFVFEEKMGDLRFGMEVSDTSGNSKWAWTHFPDAAEGEYLDSGENVVNPPSSSWTDGSSDVLAQEWAQLPVRRFYYARDFVGSMTL